jgi:uncharacterized membrane protein YciS (DUF1049 family)
MSCHGNNRKRIAIIAGAGAGAAGVIIYAYLAANPVAAAALPAVLAFAACSAMCAAMGGIMWLNHRFSKKKGNAQQIQQKQKTKKEVSNLESTTEEQEKLTIAVTGTNDERTISFEQQPPQGQRKKRNTPNQEGQKASK